MAYRECVGVVAGSHGAYAAGVLDGFVHDLEHADVAEVGVGVDVGGHPFEEFESALKLPVYIESGRRSVL